MLMGIEFSLKGEYSTSYLHIYPTVVILEDRVLGEQALGKAAATGSFHVLAIRHLGLSFLPITVGEGGGHALLQCGLGFLYFLLFLFII